MLNLPTKYIEVCFPDSDTLKKFNKKLYVRGRIRDSIRRKDIKSIPEIVRIKIDLCLARVMTILEMYPISKLKVRLQVLKNKQEVRAKFKEIYAINTTYIAFYARRKNTVYVSARNINLRVLAHELGHVIAETYFTPSPPHEVHELIAQRAERYIFD